jgi:hypothetical protein
MARKIIPLQVSLTGDEWRFYENAALYAMQGFMESPIKAETAISVAVPEVLAEESFKVADAMLEKYREKMKKFGADD